MGEISHSRDQIMRIPPGIIDELEWEVDTAVNKSLADKDPTAALDMAINLAATGYMRGLQLASLLCTIDENWDDFETDDTFEDAVFKAIGYDPKTTRKYVRMYRYVLGPHPELWGKPIGALIELTGAAANGDLTVRDWDEIAAAHDKKSIVDIRRAARGETGRGATRLVAWLDRNGYGHLRRGDEGEWKDWGYVDVNSPDEDIQALVLRLEKVGIEVI